MLAPAGSASDRMETDCHCLTKVLAELDEKAPGAPFLALGQTVFWDEPMKAGVVKALAELGSSRRFTAGVHDTDYFAKFQSPHQRTGYAALPHNDTTTKTLWSAAGEFSCLFGSETVVTKEALQKAGGKTGKVKHDRPGFLDEVTEAWGWRGVVSLNKESKITAEKRISRIFPSLYDTFKWAVDSSLSLISGPHFEDSQREGDSLLAQVCDESDALEKDCLAEFYKRMLKLMFERVAREPLDMDLTRTTELLSFTPETAGLPRFDVVGRFLDPSTRGLAEAAYNEAVRGSEIYTLDRFGAGALPFDVFVPGVGRGTLRLGTKGGLIMAAEPVGFSYKKRPTTTAELAEVLARKFGQEVVLVGKAVSLILMLAREFVFVFHEGASGYVWRSAEVERGLQAAGIGLGLNPILRIKYEPWRAMEECCAWLKLPEPLRRPFGTEELAAPSFAVRWKEVAAQQRERLAEMATLKRPLELLRYLQTSVGGQWQCLSSEYEAMTADVEELSRSLQALKVEKREVLDKIRGLKAKANELMHEKGRHWRAKIFEKEPTAADWAERERLIAAIDSAQAEVQTGWAEFRVLDDRQKAMVGSAQMTKIRDRRKDIALEAEMMRLKLIREAVMATTGLEHAGHRPAAWWFPLVCPGGAWFKATMDSAEYWLEDLG